MGDRRCKKVVGVAWGTTLRGWWQVVENEAAKLATRAMEDDAASDKHGSSLGLVRVGSKERWAKILSREESEEIESEREREKNWERYIRPEVNKQMIKKKIAMYYSAVSFMELHYSILQKILRFRTSHEAWILVFGVPNAKYLAFDTPDRNANIITIKK